MAPKAAKQPTDRVTVRLPTWLIDQMNSMVDAKMYRTTTDLVFNAIKELMVAKGADAKKTIEAQKGLLELQQIMAQMDATKRKFGLQ